MNTRFAGVLFTLIYVTGLAIGAHAQEREDTVIVRVPYDFVVDGSALRRGEYRVSRIDTARGARQLEISSLDTGASIFFIPTVFDDFTTGHPQLSFEQVGGRYFLTAIKTPIGTYAIPIPLSAITLAQMKDHSTITSAGTN
jgi:hypothetical protein